MPEHGSDAHSPEEIAARALEAGAKKARRDLPGMLALAILAGAFIGLGGLFATVAMSGSAGVLPYGIIRLLGGLVFSLGLILTVVGGAQLFTGDALMVMAWASGRVGMGRMLKVWLVVWLGNFVGAAGTALLVFLSGQYAFGDGVVGATALSIAKAKTAIPADQAFFLGILCNVLVCLAVWLALGARSVTDKVTAIVFPIAGFVAAGFEHCVANMYFVPLGLLIQWGAPEPFWTALHLAAEARPHLSLSAFAVNLAAVTLGNVVGGAVLVGAMYWFIYLRPARLSRDD